MQQKLKERLVGAAVLVAVAVIFIPIILNDSSELDTIQGSNIPEKPDTNFSSRIIPILESALIIPRLCKPAYLRHSDAQDARIGLQVF